MANSPAERQCGSCTACCEGWLRTRVDGNELRPGKPCAHFKQGACSIYPTRPQDPCISYICGWLMSPELPDWLQPSVSKVILKPNMVWERPSSNINVHIAIAVGHRIPGKTLQWLKRYSEQTGCNFICNVPVRENKEYTGEMTKFGIGPPAFVEAVEEWSMSGYEWYIMPGSTALLVGDQFYRHGK